MNIIDSSFLHGHNFKIGNFCIIEEEVIVGDDVTIENYVLLKKGTFIGDRVYIDSYVRSSGNNKIGSDVTLRYGSTIAKEVTLDDNVFLAPNVMTIYSTSNGEDLGGIYISAGVFIGTGAVIGPKVYIGEGVTIGALAYVGKDCRQAGVYVGVPAKRIS